MEIELNEHLLRTLGLRLQSMAHMPADALFAFYADDLSHAEYPDSTQSSVVPYLQGDVLHYQPDQVPHLIGSVRNLIAIEQKKHARIQQRSAIYESADGQRNDSVTLKAKARQAALCQRHEAVLSALREFLIRLTPTTCTPPSQHSL